MLPDKVSKEQVESVISRVEYIHPQNTTLTLCLLHCKNGFVCVGESACASDANYDPKLGEEYAYENAFDKLWGYEGYLLKAKLYEASQTNTYRHPSDASGSISDAATSSLSLPG